MSTTNGHQANGSPSNANASTATDANGAATAAPSKGGFWHAFRTKLITKEDPYHMHKTIGIICLLHYIWRLTMMGDDDDMGFPKYPQLTIPTLLLHVSLSASGFVFRIPKKRILKGGRIWPEYRLHSLAFASRSAAHCALLWYEAQHHLPPNYLGSFLIVLGCMIFCDVSSWSVGSYHSNSVRDLDAPAVARLFFSFMQFRATAAFVYGSRRYSFYFWVMLVVQVSAFIGTLNRKNVYSHNVAVAVYAALLGAGFYIGTREFLAMGWNAFRVIVIAATFVTVVRTGPRIPGLGWNFQHKYGKYLLWTVVYLIMPHFRSEEETDVLPEETAWVTEEQLQQMFVGSIVALLALAAWKHTRPVVDKKGGEKEMKKVQ